MYWFTADEHYYHSNIIKFCNRPFSSVIEMNEEIIRRNNEVVENNDIVVHAGDFAFKSSHESVVKLIKQLKGIHIFVRGSHDKWLNDRSHEIWEINIKGIYVVVCHYAMRVWPKSHFNSILLYGHSHGGLEPIGKSYDVGVDSNNFYPYSFEQIKDIMKHRPNNFNYVKERRSE